MFCVSTHIVTRSVTRLTRVPLVEQELLTLPKHLRSPPVFSGVRITWSLVLCVCFVDRLSFCIFSFGHCVVCSSSIYGLITALGSSNSSRSSLYLLSCTSTCVILVCIVSITEYIVYCYCLPFNQKRQYYKKNINIYIWQKTVFDSPARSRHQGKEIDQSTKTVFDWLVCCH